MPPRQRRSCTSHLPSLSLSLIFLCIVDIPCISLSGWEVELVCPWSKLHFCSGLNLENPDSLAAQAKVYATQYGDSFLYFYNYVVDKSRGIESQ